ncbi:hypothetical protein MTR67_039571 [Solanum verrucosum]|uniref:Integrase catalytic domain-containing protein n=1 Tax=Solanum verrucosum TaxID=315347 RepID=A0AAF0UIP4_SOLVR|nr:hypothetical protein MTR67_039568 [Solanum verrucosum]WMV46186.1 hypothetical protein MTR67_039571 [Solanum verrucosum]
MDFVVGLSRTSRGLDSIWVIVDRLTNSAHFVHVHTSYSAERLELIYIREVGRLHGVPVSIISGRGPQFTSSFWRTFQDELGTRIDLSTAFHPQTDGQSDRTIQVLEDMLRACVMDFGGQWDQYLPLAEFAYNNSYYSSIQMALFEDLFGRRCRSPVGWFESIERRPSGTNLMREALDHIRVIQDRMRIAQSRHQSYADSMRRPLKFSVRDRVFHHVSPMKDESHVIQYDAVDLDDSLRYIGEPVALLVRCVRRLRSRAIPVVKVHWRHRPAEEATWETEHEMRA